MNAVTSPKRHSSVPPLTTLSAPKAPPADEVADYARQCAAAAHAIPLTADPRFRQLAHRLSASITLEAAQYSATGQCWDDLAAAAKWCKKNPTRSALAPWVCGVAKLEAEDAAAAAAYGAQLRARRLAIVQDLIAHAPDVYDLACNATDPEVKAMAKAEWSRRIYAAQDTPAAAPPAPTIPPRPTDPTARAEWEWDHAQAPCVRGAWINRAVYVSVRKRELARVN